MERDKDPILNPRDCSTEGLRDIIATDSRCSQAYIDELKKRGEMEAWEEEYEDNF